MQRSDPYSNAHAPQAAPFFDRSLVFNPSLRPAQGALNRPQLNEPAKDGANSLGPFAVDDELAVDRVVPERHRAPIHMPFAFDAAILSRTRSAPTSRWNCANESST